MAIACRTVCAALIAAGVWCLPTTSAWAAQADARLLDAARPRALDNANTPQDAASVRAALAAGGQA